jgi:hypothetical protein
LSKNQSLEKSDKLIVVMTILIALLLFSWLVYDIAFLNISLKGQVEIGQIYETQNKVKRKFSKSLIWYAASSNETVYENDWIFTGSESIAKIKLNSGGEIIVEPDSLIVLSKKNGVLQLDLQHGRLMADVKKSDIKINIVRNGSVEAVDTDKGKIQIVNKVEEKEVKIEPILEDINKNTSLSELADKKYYEPSEGYSTLDKNGLSYQIYNYKSVQLFPNQKTTLPLNWSDPLAKWQSYEINLANDVNFQDIILSQKMETTGLQVPTSQSNIYHWRVRGIKGDKVSDWSESLISELDIKQLDIGPPVELSQKNIKYQIEEPDLSNISSNKVLTVSDTKPVKIKWKPDKNAKKYRFQTSNTKDFNDIIDEKIISETEMNLSDLNIGDTYYRIVPENDNGEIVAKESKGKVRTYLPSPADESLQTIDKDEYQVMTWDKVPFAELYEVTYSHDKKGSEKIVEYVESNKFKVDNKTGFLKWKVRVVEPENKENLSQFSKTVDWYDSAKRLASLHGSGQAGTLYPVITKPETRKTFISINNSPLFIVMAWQYEQNAIGYDVEISKTPEMSQLVYKKTVSEKKRAVINQNFTPGIYYMRVRAKHDEVSEESWSESEVFRVINRELK